jgi:hypothetical protein
MITLEQYFGKWMGYPDATPERKSAAAAMLERVNALLVAAEAAGITVPINPHTGSQVSGETLGGFRPQNCAIGSPKSAHKTGRAVDVFDPENKLDDWLDDARLEAFDLYREHPNATPRWCHLSDRAPGSGNRTFWP